jgi:hypothetical protein
MLVEVAQRYGKPLFIAETGAEGSARASWLHYVCQEVREAQSRDVPIEGICLYPITAYPGWDNGRQCDVGLLSAPGPDGARTLDGPLYDELERQRAIFGIEEPDEARFGHLRLAAGRRT